MVSVRLSVALHPIGAAVLGLFGAAAASAPFTILSFFTQEVRPSSSSTWRLERGDLEGIKSYPSRPAPDARRYGYGGCVAFSASAHRFGNNVLAVAALKNPIVKMDIRI
jgi:hypothetical protein